jgi:antitoxin (DNA-binding transcriptional repressor) of toxin-antitoxin stability system
MDVGYAGGEQLLAPYHHIGTGQLRSRILDYLERVSAGEVIEIARRGRLVARMESLTNTRHPGAGRPTPVEPQVVTGVRVTELRQAAGRVLDRVAGGDVVEVLVEGQAVARIVSSDKCSQDD